MNRIREVAQRADIAAVLERYGNIKLKGKMFSCPFHGDDKHPSAGIRSNNRWGCLACGAAGDAVDFVSRIMNTSPSKAAKIINDDFSLGVNMRRLSLEERKRQASERREKEELRKKIEVKRKKLTNIHRAYVYAIAHFAPKTPSDLDNLDPRYVQAVKEIDIIAYELDELDGIA